MKQEISEIQKQFWTLSKVLANDSVYNIVSAVKIEGPLDVDKLQQSWENVFKLIPLFYTTFKEQNGTVYRDVVENPVCPWEVNKVADSKQAEQLIQKLADKPFNLENELPVKAFFISVSSKLNYFFILQHHIITDLHSKNILSKVLSDFYNTGVCEAEPADYVYTENSEKTKKQSIFWEKYLNNSAEPLNLPSEKTSRYVFNGSGTTLFGELSVGVSGKIEGLKQDKQIQPFLLLLSAYAVVLSKLSGQKDFYIGVPFPNRRGNERINMYGPFVNILPLHIFIGGDESLTSLYTKIRKQMLLLHRNQEVSFSDILMHYNGSRNPDIPYFLQAGFTKEEPFSLSLDNLVCTSVDIRPSGSQMDLFFTFWRDKDIFKYRWEFNTNSFNTKQVESWQESYKKIIDSYLNNIDVSVSEISIISDKDKKDLSDLFIKNKRDYPLDTPFGSHLISSYSKYSENIAIKDESRSLSYGEFAGLVKKYASYFNIEAGRGNVIAIIMDRSIDRTAIIHAIICSGNSYLPVDPKWPRERIKYILSNAEVKFTVSHSIFKTRIPGDQRTIFIEELNKQETTETFPDNKKNFNDQIAVIYTSGSTGEPKGVSISGKGITNRLFWMQETFPINSLDTLIHKVPYTFDVSMWEIFWPFLTGASLFIPNSDKHLDDLYLAEVINQEKISYIHFVPSLLNKFLKNVETPSFPLLRGVICSGEALEVSLLKKFYNKFPNTALFNLYGPTEASIDVTAWSCSPEDASLSQLPIGYPIANTRIYILDKESNLCPPYVRGEIGIAGVNLAHGYINNIELTNLSFIKGNWGFGEEIVYRTGDIGYYHEDCRIEYSGRKDSQIKINGIRIELSEIERYLETLSYINSAVVLRDKKQDFGVELNAYITPANIEYKEKIISDIAGFLPGYMIPHNFYFFDQFPMLGNGKVDKKKLLSSSNVFNLLNKVNPVIEKMEENYQRQGIRKISIRNRNRKSKS